MHRLIAKLLLLHALVLLMEPGLASAAVFGPPNCGVLSSTDLVTEMTHEIESRIDGVTADASTTQTFNSRGTNTEPWTRNTSVWTSEDTPLDLTGVSPWNSNAGLTKGGTLITPRHIIFADHYQITTGSTIAFITADNTIITRTLVAHTTVADDIHIGLLDSDVPASIAYYPLITYPEVDNFFTDENPLFILFDQEEKALIKQQVRPSIQHQLIHNAPASTSLAFPFSEDLIAGDSGKPGFYVVHGQPILAMTTTSSGGGDFTGYFIDEINAAIEQLGSSGGYEVSRYDFSCFDYLNEPPEFTSDHYSYSLSEDAVTDDSVGTPSATDPNINSNITYSITSSTATSTFSIDADTGALTVTDGDLLDYDINPSYDLIVQAIDDAPSPLLATTSVHIDITTTNRPMVRLLTSAQSITETAGGVDIVLRLTGLYGKEITVTLTTTDGSGSDGTDYTGTSTIVTIPAGNQFATTTIPILHNPRSDNDRTFSVSLASPTHALLTTPITNTITITDTDNDETPNRGGGGGGKAKTKNEDSGTIHALETRVAELRLILVRLLSRTNQTTPQQEFIPPSPHTALFMRDLEVGSLGEDVRQLQIFLNESGYPVAPTGPGSRGNETTYFGPATRTALIQFQHGKGITPAIGIFGPITRSSVATLCASVNPISC